jgi:hypothetical protein
MPVNADREVKIVNETRIHIEGMEYRNDNMTDMKSDY